MHPPKPYLRDSEVPGRALGRSYRVKLWPTLVLLRDGQEAARLVRLHAGPTGLEGPDR